MNSLFKPGCTNPVEWDSRDGLSLSLFIYSSKTTFYGITEMSPMEERIAITAHITFFKSGPLSSEKYTFKIMLKILTRKNTGKT